MARPGLMRRLRGLGVVLVLASVLGCSARVPERGAPAIVRIGWADVGLPTPFRVSTAGPGGAVLISLIYDTLTWKDEHSIVPWLATSWDLSPDGRDVTFTLAHNVRWQDGQLLTADDVAFSFDYYAVHPFRWMATDIVASATVLSTDRVLLRLREPYPPFIEEVTSVVPIIPRHVWTNVTDPLTYDAADATLGSGPFGLCSAVAALPEFLVGMLLLLTLAVGLGWLPLQGGQTPFAPAAQPWWEVFGDRLNHLALPAATLVLTNLAAFVLLSRGAVRGVLAEPYLATARAKGVVEWRVAVQHAAPNALLPVLTRRHLRRECPMPPTAARGLRRGGEVRLEMQPQSLWPQHDRYTRRHRL